MCGIFCKLCFKKEKHSIDKYINLDKNLTHLLKCRGPDRQNSILLTYSALTATWKEKKNYTHKSENPYECQNVDHLYSEESLPTLSSDCDYSMEISGTTLWTQGSTDPTLQPLRSDYGVLLFNGDIFDSTWNKNKSDTEQIFEKLNPKMNTDNEPDSKFILSILKSLKGPFSLIYLDKLNNKLYFCRDRLGRHSLLFCKKDNEYLISSILGRNYKGAFELPAISIYCLDINNFKIHEYSWAQNITLSDVSIDVWSFSQKLVNQIYEISTTLLNKEDSMYLKRIEDSSGNYTSSIEILENIIKDKEVLQNVNLLIKKLSESVKVRVDTQPNRCKRCATTDVICVRHCTVGILFSGGLDCTILAVLAHHHVPLNQPIDLLNVAFERENYSNFDVPDRLTAWQSYDELKQLFPQREWNLLEINISSIELLEKQKGEIGDLVFPLQTVLDESLGSALWFAARGKCSSNDDSNSSKNFAKSNDSQCRILLMGMGADELFGGYTRHRAAFKRGEWIELEKELQIDWQRIASRNLARDDRVVSHHGRQPRMPYLDEPFVDFVLNLKPWEKCIPSSKFGPGVGDKMLLRLAALHLGLKLTSVLPKRAIQFGSRIAKKKENGSDLSSRLAAT